MMAAADIALRLGLEESRLSWRGTCPACAYPRTFSIRELKGRIVTFCGNGCDRGALAEALARVTGADFKPDKAATENHDEAARRVRATADALKIWVGSTSALHTLADMYLIGRALPGLAASAALRFRGDCHHPEQRGRYPALVALVQDVAADPMAVHRTYLRAGGFKATMEPPKASRGPVWGGAIRLDPAASEIVIGEGIESSASAGRLLDLPAWAALSAGNMAKGLILPPEVRAVVIAADADEAGNKAAETAADRWRAEGRHVRIARPDRPGRDFNDLLCAGMEADHAR
jgi:hypothetical protein